MQIDELKAELFETVRDMAELLNDVLQSAKTTNGLTPLQLRALLLLHNEKEVSVGSLATAIGVAYSNASAMCKRLEADGFIKRVRTLKDERIVCLRLTGKGCETADEIGRILNERMLSAWQNQSEDDLGDIIKGLQKLRAITKTALSTAK